MKYNTICKVPTEVRDSIERVIKNPGKRSSEHMHNCGRIAGILETITVLGIISWIENNELFNYYNNWYWHYVDKKGA